MNQNSAAELPSAKEAQRRSSARTAWWLARAFALRLYALGGSALGVVSGCHDSPGDSRTVASAAAPAAASPHLSGHVDARAERAHHAAPAPAAKGLAADGALQLSAADRCPVCAMRVTREKKLASAIELDDGTTYYFCGTGCMLKTWLHPQDHLGVPKARLKRAVTRDYFTGRPLDAGVAIWIAGSDVVGPMGPAIVPLADAAAADTFRSRHGGQHQFRMEELTADKWRFIISSRSQR